MTHSSLTLLSPFSYLFLCIDVNIECASLTVLSLYASQVQTFL